HPIPLKMGVLCGHPPTTTGGNALKFYSSVRLEIRRIESIDGKGEEDAVGNRVRVKVVKNKVAPPFRKVELDIYFGKGVSATASLLDSAVKHGMIDKRGAWYTRGEEKVGQGKENAINFLAQNPDYAHTLEVQLRSELFPGQVLKNKEGVAVYPEQEKAVKAAAKAAKDAKPAADAAVSVTPAGTAATKPESAAAGVSAKDALF
ncbi:MAG: recombinase RecA, partial [Treponemataceae bacterium]|nr:recombinase RecA [Treponemataceae bacterium]